MFGTDAVYHMSRGNGPGFAHGVADALRGLNPEVQVSVYNAGVPASGPDVLLSCIHNWLPARKRVDVFVFEYTVTLKSDNRCASPRHAKPCGVRTCASLSKFSLRFETKAVPD